jgi:hypothetical protein
MKNLSTILFLSFLLLSSPKHLKQDELGIIHKRAGSSCPTNIIGDYHTFQMFIGDNIGQIYMKAQGSGFVLILGYSSDPTFTSYLYKIEINKSHTKIFKQRDDNVICEFDQIIDPFTVYEYNFEISTVSKLIRLRNFWICNEPGMNYIGSDILGISRSDGINTCSIIQGVAQVPKNVIAMNFGYARK